MKITQYLGIFLGALYGIFFRLVTGIEYVSGLYSIYSITFIWITPIIISLIPVFISSNSLYKSKSKLFFFPALAVLLFGFIAFSAGLEDLLCILILFFPYLLTAGIIGILVGTIISRNKINKKIFSIVLLPFILNPIENILPDNTDQYSVVSRVTINQSKSIIWKNIIEVPEILDEEYNNGFFNIIGVPRPVKSELRTIDNQIYRIGYFTDNLKLYETISDIDENRFVNFKIHIDKSELRNKPTDQHLLKGNYFSFENISYKLHPIDNNRTE
jgi:hypothetical protein